MDNKLNLDSGTWECKCSKFLSYYTTWNDQTEPTCGDNKMRNVIKKEFNTAINMSRMRATIWVIMVMKKR